MRLLPGGRFNLSVNALFSGALVECSVIVHQLSSWFRAILWLLSTGQHLCAWSLHQVLCISQLYQPPNKSLNTQANACWDARYASAR